MIRALTFLTTAFTALLLVVACENNAPTPAPSTTSMDNTRSITTNQQVQFNGKVININTEDIVAVASKSTAANADEQALLNINQAFLGAEKEAQLLEVNFTMSDEPVDNGMFIFGIESPQPNNLTLEVFDEEGFAMVANNEFNITEGNNYKALNVASLDNGTYSFRIKDQTGKELNRTMVVQQ